MSPYTMNNGIPHNNRSSSDSIYYDSDEESINPMIRTVPCIENIVMGREKTVELNEGLPTPRKNRSFPCLLVSVNEDAIGVPKDRENAGCIGQHLLGFHKYRGRKCLVFWGYAAFLVTALRIGDWATGKHELRNQLQTQAMQKGTFFSAGGGTYTYYGETKDVSAKELKAESGNRPQYLVGGSPPVGIVLPENLSDIADVSSERREGDIPLFWQVPRSAGNTVKNIMGLCLGFVEASDMGGLYADTEKLEIIEREGIKFVNVDTSTLSGIERAKSLQIASSNIVDVMISLFVQDISTVFTPSNQGRLFTLLRHPVDRAVSVFYYISQVNSFEPQLASMTLEEYARSSHIENNWMTRFLTGHVGGELNEGHLDLAKEIIRRKCLVGIFEEKKETFKRFEQFFNWNIPDKRSRQCVDRLIMDTWPNRHDHPLVREGTELWNLLTMRNKFDLELYHYAKIVFAEQRSLFQ